MGSKARLAMTLGLYTGQARQDVIPMGEQHISERCWTGSLKTEDKTGFELAIPVHPELRKIIDATPSRHLSSWLPSSAAVHRRRFRQLVSRPLQ